MKHQNLLFVYLDAPSCLGVFLQDLLTVLIREEGKTLYSVGEPDSGRRYDAPKC